VLGGRFGFRDRAAFFKNFASSPLVRYVRLINATSAVVAKGWKEPVSLLFIDGDHRYAAVRADFAAWEPHLVAGATVAFDDCNLAGPRKLTAELSADGALHPIKQVRKLGLFRFAGRPAAAERKAGGRGAASARPIEAAANDGYTVSAKATGYGVYYGGNGAYLYQPVTKCACTSIKTLLLEFEGLPVDGDVWRRHQKRYNRFPGTGHLPIRQQLDIFEGLTPTFKFVFVRNPYTRLASVYCDKIRDRPSPHFVNQIEQSAARLGIGLSDPITFDEFVGVVSRQGIAEMDPHWRPQYYEGRFGTVRYDFVGRMETMPNDLIYALERINAPAALIERAGDRLNATGAPLDLWASVSPEVHRQYLATFAIDFDVLQYPRRLPGAGSVSGSPEAGLASPNGAAPDRSATLPGELAAAADAQGVRSRRRPPSARRKPRG
jgi:hypothetical protein